MEEEAVGEGPAQRKAKSYPLSSLREAFDADVVTRVHRRIHTRDRRKDAALLEQEEARCMGGTGATKAISYRHSVLS